jgi:hypothetical protein
MTDIVKMDVPLFIRLLELAREEIKQDVDLHDVAEAVIALSQDGVATMNDYDTIVGHMKATDDHDMGETTDELARIKQLGGIQ